MDSDSRLSHRNKKSARATRKLQDGRITNCRILVIPFEFTLTGGFHPLVVLPRKNVVLMSEASSLRIHSVTLILLSAQLLSMQPVVLKVPYRRWLARVTNRGGCCGWIWHIGLATGDSSYDSLALCSTLPSCALHHLAEFALVLQNCVL